MSTRKADPVSGWRPATKEMPPPNELVAGPHRRRLARPKDRPPKRLSPAVPQRTHPAFQRSPKGGSPQPVALQPLIGGGAQPVAHSGTADRSDVPIPLGWRWGGSPAYFGHGAC